MYFQELQRESEYDAIPPITATNFSIKTQTPISLSNHLRATNPASADFLILKLCCLKNLPSSSCWTSFPPLNPRINMNIADGRGLKFVLITSIFTLWIKSLLGCKLLEDQLHSRVWSLNPSSLSAHFGSSVYLDLNCLRINCSTLGKSTSQGENQSTVRRQQHQIPNMLFSCKSLVFSMTFSKVQEKGVHSSSSAKQCCDLLHSSGQKTRSRTGT